MSDLVKLLREVFTLLEKVRLLSEEQSRLEDSVKREVELFRQAVHDLDKRVAVIEARADSQSDGLDAKLAQFEYRVSSALLALEHALAKLPIIANQPGSVKVLGQERPKRGRGRDDGAAKIAE